MTTVFIIGFIISPVLGLLSALYVFISWFFLRAPHSMLPTQKVAGLVLVLAGGWSRVVGGVGVRGQAGPSLGIREPRWSIGSIKLQTHFTDLGGPGLPKPVKWTCNLIVF